MLRTKPLSEEAAFAFPRSVEWQGAGLKTSPVSWPDAEAAIYAGYRLAGLNPPTIVHAASPQAALEAISRHLDVSTPKARGGAAFRTGDVFSWSSSAGPLGEFLSSAIISHADMPSPRWRTAQPARVISSAQFDQIAAKLRDMAEGMGHKFANLSACMNAFYGLAHSNNYTKLTDAISRFRAVREQIAATCGWVWPMEGVCIACERPTTFKLDDRQRLHAPDSAAVTWPDGWDIHAWHGVIVPHNIILSPGQITVKAIEVEDNTEVRRVMIERFGLDRYIKASKAQLLQQDRYGKLWRKRQSRGEALYAVEVINSTPEPDGSVRHYFLQVPSSVRSAHEAVAWTFGKTPDTYNPLAET